MCVLCCSGLSAHAAFESYDFSSLPESYDLPVEGYEASGITFYGYGSFYQDMDLYYPGQNGLVLFEAGMVAFVFNPSLAVNQVTATIGGNNCPTRFQVFGTLGSDSFSSNSFANPTTQTISGIGTISTIIFSTSEGFLSDLKYEVVTQPVSTPIPGALSLLASGLAGLSALSRRKP